MYKYSNSPHFISHQYMGFQLSEEEEVLLPDSNSIYPTSAAVPAISTPLLLSSGTLTSYGSNQQLRVNPIDLQDGHINCKPYSWRDDKILLLQIFTTFYGFIVAGLSDQTIGSLLPSFQSHYKISDFEASLLFFIQSSGYLISAGFNDYLHRNYGIFGVSLIGTIAETFYFLIAFTKPSFHVLLFAYIFAGLGKGCVDACWNAYISKLNNNNEIMGILHACYGLGSLMTPMIVTILLTNKLDWSWTFGILAAFSLFTIVLVLISFRNETGEKYLEEVEAHQPNNQGLGEANVSIMKIALSHKVIWFIALYLFLYCGTEVGIGGWAVSYMIRIKHGAENKMTIITTFFWSGITIGRLVLGFVTGKFSGNEHRIATIYAVISFFFFVLFSFVPGDSMIFSGATLMITGIFLGPLFPTAIIFARQLLPAHLYLAGVGFAAAFGGGGAAVCPAIIGFITHLFGSLVVLGPVVCISLSIMIVVWIITPHIARTENLKQNLRQIRTTEQYMTSIA